MQGLSGTIIYFVVIIAIFYFMLIRPQKKQQQRMMKMLDSLQINDEVVTAGGIVGKIVSLKDDTVVIETSADRNKIKFQKSAISQVLTVHEDNN